MTDFTDDMRRRLDRQVGDTEDDTLIEVRSGDLRALLRAYGDQAEDVEHLRDELETELAGARSEGYAEGYEAGAHAREEAA